MLMNGLPKLMNAIQILVNQLRMLMNVLLILDNLSVIQLNPSRMNMRSNPRMNSRLFFQIKSVGIQMDFIGKFPGLSPIIFPQN